jgi:hypothetical protein
MQHSSAVFGRSDVARLLDMPEWLLANFADKRYPYGLTPSVRGGKGRGKKGLYSLGDVYKIAVAHRLLAAGFVSWVVAEALNELFPRKFDPIEIAVRDRASTPEDARYILLDFSLAYWVEQGKLPDEWRNGNPQQQRWARLVTRIVLSLAWQVGAMRTAFAMPFDGLLNWVDSRILGREITIDRPKLPVVKDLEQILRNRLTPKEMSAAKSERKHKGQGEER